LDCSLQNARAEFEIFFLLYVLQAIDDKMRKSSHSCLHNKFVVKNKPCLGYATINEGDNHWFIPSKVLTTWQSNEVVSRIIWLTPKFWIVNWDLFICMLWGSRFWNRFIDWVSYSHFPSSNSPILVTKNKNLSTCYDFLRVF